MGLKVRPFRHFHICWTSRNCGYRKHQKAYLFSNFQQWVDHHDRIGQIVHLTLSLPSVLAVSVINLHLRTGCLPKYAHPAQSHPPSEIQWKQVNCSKMLWLCVREVKKRHYLAKKCNDYITNFHQYFNLKVGVIVQVGGRIWSLNQ